VHQELRALVLGYLSRRIDGLRLRPEDGGRLSVPGTPDGPTLFVARHVLILAHGTHLPF
jgi:hypothetical protein